MTGRIGEEPKRYHNFLQQVIHEIIERLTGITFADYVKTTIFSPLGMTRSGYTTAEVGIDLVAGHEAAIVPIPTGWETQLRQVSSGLDALGDSIGHASCRLISCTEDLVSPAVRHS